MGTRLNITLDCVDPERLARFWAAALDYEDGGRHKTATVPAYQLPEVG